MQREEVALQAHGEEFDAELAVPDDPDGRGVAVMPGGGHGPWGDIFDRFAEDAAADGVHVIRFEGWPTPEVLMGKTVRDMHAELDAAVDRLREEGCTELGVVGKSFGGGVTLTHVPEGVDRVVLWAPAFVTFGDEETVSDSLDDSLEALKDAPERRQISAAWMADFDASLRVIQGDEDDVRSVEHARKVVDAAPDAELVVREGEDHSFRGDDREQEIVDQTLDFL
ncbi:MAG: alpha/beta hydrolase family protein [Halobacterium sp.]